MSPDTKKSIAGKLILYVILASLFLLGLGLIFPSFWDFDSSGTLRLLALVFLYVGPVVLLIRWISSKFKKNQPAATNKSIDHGSAEWATQQQFMGLGYEYWKPGLWIGDGITRSKSGHLLTIAGSGMGKNACIILPNLLIEPFGSYVVTDPKGENAFITARFQKESNQRVFILDPWNQQETMGARHSIQPSGFNPFDFIKREPSEIRDNCELIASYLIPDKPDSKDPYWDDRARTLIRTCLMHIVTFKPPEEHNFWTLYKMLRLSEDEWLDLLLEMKKNESLDGLVKIASGEFSGMDPMGSTFVGIRSNAQNATGIFESPQLRQSLQKSDFNPYDLADGDYTVYVVIPERFLETHSGWLRLVVGLCLKAVNSRPNKRVNFFLDEFAVMGKMKDVQRAYAFSRGQNIVMWAFAQSLSQIKEIYGEDGMNTFLSNSAVFQAFGIKDQYTKEYVSKALGDATYMKTSISTTDNGRDGSTSISQSSFGRSLLMPEEVEKFPYIIIITEGLKYYLAKIGYYQNRYERMSVNDPYLSPEQKKLIKSGQLPKDMREWFTDRADPPPRILA